MNSRNRDKDSDFKSWISCFKKNKVQRMNLFLNTGRGGHLLLFADNCVPEKPKTKKPLNYKSVANKIRTYEMDGHNISL